MNLRRLFKKNTTKKFRSLDDIQKKMIMEDRRTAPAFSECQTHEILNALINAGIINEETVAEDLENGHCLKTVVLRPGHNTILFDQPNAR